MLFKKSTMITSNSKNNKQKSQETERRNNSFLKE